MYIPEGGINKIISHLIKNNFQLSSVDALLLRSIGKPQKGWIDVGSEHLSRFDFLHRIANAKAAMFDVVLIPGETNYFLFKELSEKSSLDASKLEYYYNKYAPYKDGVILPDTYSIPIGIKENHIMYYLVNRSLQKHKNMSIKILGEYDQNQWFKYVTIASIIQKEAANIEEMPLISAVIRNRLRRGMPLQMDGSLNYGEFSHVKVTPKMIKSDTSRYNTYKYKGIPPHPVGSTSIEALRAALSPADVDYLYFVRDKDGSHTFSKTYKEHLDKIRR